MDERLKKQLDFILEVDKSKFVVRQTYLTDGIRKKKMMQNIPGILHLWQSYWRNIQMNRLTY